jgi:hypothetical protein
VNYFHFSFLCVSLIADFLNTGRLEHRRSYLHCDVNINTAHPRLQKIHHYTCQLQGLPQDWRHSSKTFKREVAPPAARTAWAAWAPAGGADGAAPAPAGGASPYKASKNTSNCFVLDLAVGFVGAVEHRPFAGSAVGFPTAYPGPIHQFLSDIPDWMNISQEDLYLALESLPIPLKGPISPGISLQEAIQVHQRHNIHMRQHQNIILHTNRNTISYADIVHYICIIITDIVYNIGYDIVYDV